MKITTAFIQSLGLSLEELIDWIVRQAEQILALVAQRDALREQLQQKNARVVQLEEKLEQTQRQAFRQAAPFRIPEQQRNPSPQKPGRKPGHPASWRPKPDRIDQHLRVPLPDCPHCHGPLQDRREVIQYIQEIPTVQPQNVELITQEGYCPACDQYVRSAHELQVSLAEGAAGVQLGPNALATAIELNKVKGLSLRKTSATLKDLFGLKITPGGLSQAMMRVARKLQGSYQALIQRLRQATFVHADETSWWVGGPGYWLWVFTNAETTVYVVDPRRGRQVVQETLGADYAGVLVSDCLSTYDEATSLQHKCYGHHLVALKEAIQEHPQQGEGFLLQVRALLRTAMLFKAMDADPNTEQYQQCLRGFERQAQQLLSTPRSQPQEERIRNRLFKQQDHLFTFLKYPEVEATNNRAERQLRPAVIARKISCGNKTTNGSWAWQVLTSVAVSVAQQGQSFADIVRTAVRLPPARAP